METKIMLEREDKDNFYFILDSNFLEKLKQHKSRLCSIYFDEESQKVIFAIEII